MNHTLIASGEFLTKKKKTRSEYISAELESFPFLTLPCSSVDCLIIQNENENWSLKHLYLNKDGEADYGCSKCNFYYTSIILLLITDSFSLRSSSKTRSCSIHVHTGGKNLQGYLKCLICGGIILLLEKESICYTEHHLLFDRHSVSNHSTSEKLLYENNPLFARIEIKVFVNSNLHFFLFSLPSIERVIFSRRDEI